MVSVLPLLSDGQERPVVNSVDLPDRLQDRPQAVVKRAENGDDGCC